MAQGRNWSNDSNFISDMNILKQKYIEADISHDLPSKLAYLKNFHMLLKPKMNLDLEDKQIDWCERNMQFVYFVNQKGETGTNLQNEQAMNKFMKKIMDNILKKSQEAGIYTQQSGDARKALGTGFGGS